MTITPSAESTASANNVTATQTHPGAGAAAAGVVPIVAAEGTRVALAIRLCFKIQVCHDIQKYRHLFCILDSKRLVEGYYFPHCWSWAHHLHPLVKDRSYAAMDVCKVQIHTTESRGKSGSGGRRRGRGKGCGIDIITLVVTGFISITSTSTTNTTTTVAPTADANTDVTTVATIITQAP
jgi:hypothetical protein